MQKVENLFFVRTRAIYCADIRLVQPYEAKGNYTLTQVYTYDANRLTRYNSGAFGLQVYINNTYEDLYPPQYVPNSAKLSVSDAYTDKNEHYYTVTATWQVKEDRQLIGSTYMYPEEQDSIGDTYYLSSSSAGGTVYASTVSREDDIWTLKATFVFPHYMPGGVYELKRLYFSDAINRENAWLPND